MRVLIVEGDGPLGLFLQKSLQREGLAADWVQSGSEALVRAAETSPDMVVLDLALGAGAEGVDGTAALTALQRSHPGVSVLALTQRNEVEERVRCLNLGADDCLLKPFSFHELAARCRAILRRRERFADPVVRVGAVEMNRMSRRVTHAGAVLELTAREYALLEVLMLRRGQCCGRAELLEQVWQGAADIGANVVDVYITYLRRKLAAACPEANFGDSAIETVRGVGYRIRTTEAGQREAATAQGAERVAETSLTRAPERSREAVRDRMQETRRGAVASNSGQSGRSSGSVTATQRWSA